MKKIQFLLIIALVAMMVSCKQEEQQTEKKQLVIEEKEPLKNPENVTLQKIRLGQELAIYGYENESAEALIEAANILVNIQTEALQAECEQGQEEGQEAAVKTTEERSMVPADLLAKAKELAGEDANILAMIKKVEEKMAAPADGERGSTLSPDAKVAVAECPSLGWYRFKVEFREGEIAECAVVGDGDTDLDLYIYDQNCNLITSDSDNTDNCYCSWTPRWTGNFILKVVNRGTVNNKFTMVVN